MLYTPGRVAVNGRVVYRPGNTSCLTRNAGTAKLCITSIEVMLNLTGWLTGTCSSLFSHCPVGCCAFHIHCLPCTKISRASSSGRDICTNRIAAHTNVMIERMSGMNVHVNSSRSAPSICTGTSSGERRRYFMAKVTSAIAMPADISTDSMVIHQNRESTRNATLEAPTPILNLPLQLASVRLAVGVRV